MSDAAVEETSGALGTPGRPLRAAIVGSGPSGFYAAEALLQSGLTVEVDLIERLPVPYGLVRFGVAPDHAKLKSVSTVFAEIARDERVRFFGNVALGREISADQLEAIYHAVVVATGADDDQKLDIEGEHLCGVHAARDFVGWYNGKPECACLAFDLSQEVVVIVGQGNVAIDVCRILAKPIDDLRKTDITEFALDSLASSRVREIHLVGRRGPVQAKFTPKELRELGSLPGWEPVVDPADLELNEASRVELANPGLAHVAKNYEILRSYATRPRERLRSICLDFFQAPVALEGDERVRSVMVERQRLEGPATAQAAIPTGECFRLEAGLVFRSVGYRGSALPGLPFDERRGVIPHQEGRVMVLPNRPMQGWYVTGWIKRGPTGIIGTNRLDSVETVSRLIEDLPAIDVPKPGRAALVAALDAVGHRPVSLEDWLAIEQAEIERGRARRKTAEKFVLVADMLAAARRTQAQAII
jgi:ferredoxin--NADP+ reductase